MKTNFLIVGVEFAIIERIVIEDNVPLNIIFHLDVLDKETVRLKTKHEVGLCVLQRKRLVHGDHIILYALLECSVKNLTQLFKLINSVDKDYRVDNKRYYCAECCVVCVAPLHLKV